MITQWYPPEPDMKIHLLGRELVARGHEVTVVTGFPNYPTGILFPGYRMRWRQIEEIEGVRVVRVPLFPDHSNVTWRRALNYASFAISAALIAPFTVGALDVIWVYHPPPTVALPALLLRRLRRAPIVYEVQDLWPETLKATGVVTSERALRLIGRSMDHIFRRVDALTVISPGFKDNIAERGVPRESISVIPNWADETAYYPADPDPVVSAGLAFDGRFNILYAGNLGAAQDLDNVLDAAALLPDGCGIKIHLMGDGVEARRLRQRSAHLGLTNVQFLERRPVKDMPVAFAAADCMLVHLGTDPVFGITIPSKLTSYMACGRPIIAVVQGDAAWVLNKSGAGKACAPGSPSVLAEAMLTMANASTRTLRQHAHKGREYFCRKFTKNAIMADYERLFLAVAGRRQNCNQG